MWVEYSVVNIAPIGGVKYFNRLSDNWTVPAIPPVPYNGLSSFQLIYLFDGLQNQLVYNHDTVILQPVLQYGFNGDFGGNYWSFASWLVGTNWAVHSVPIVVNPGDSLTGWMSLVSHATSFTWIWDIQANDNTTGQASNATYDLGIFTAVPSLTIGYPAVLEVANLWMCTQFPQDPSLTPPLNWESVFPLVSASQAGPNWNNLNWINLVPGGNWGVVVNAGLPIPACGYKVVNLHAPFLIDSVLYY